MRQINELLCREHTNATVRTGSLLSSMSMYTTQFLFMSLRTASSGG
jgi:hypothetical protein